MNFRVSLDNKYIFIALVVVILAILYWLRTGLFQFQGLFEPDGFFYYTALKQLIANGYIFHEHVQLSGYPYPNNFNEAPGLLYFVAVPYLFLQFFGFTPLGVMRVMPIVFGALDAIACYFIMQHITKSKALGLLSMFFIATSSGNIARTAGTVFRGDTFISFFLLVALFLMLKILEEDNARKRYIYAALAAFIVSISNFVWNGGVIIPAVYLAGIAAVAIYGFVAADRKALERSQLVLLTLFVSYVLNQVYLATTAINPTLMTTPDFFVLFIPLAAGTIIAQYIISRREAGKLPMLSGITRSISTRFAVVVILIIVVAGLAALADSSYVTSLLTNGGSIYIGGNIASTTQELQPPSSAFLWASFGLQLFLAPIGVLLFIFLAHRHGNTKYVRKGKISVNVNYAFIVLLVFLAMAAYLQNGAIRYNSILSIPLAIFSAYAVYAVYKIAEPYSISMSGSQIKIAYMTGVFVLILLLYQVVLTQAQSSASYQADGINPDFLSAMTWLSNNTASNSTVLALWPDGSVVEGFGDRRAFMDSVGGENATRIVQFGSYLFNTTPDTGYLLTKAHRPDYILARNFWLDELGGIAIEANITSNLSKYGYNVMTNFSISGNSTNQVYQFGSSSYVTELVIKPQANGSRSIAAFIAPAGSDEFAPIQHILFFNGTSQNYNLISSNRTSALNFTLLVGFQGRNITNAALLGAALPFTNLFKMLTECSYTQCALSDRNVTARLVFANPDTRIIELTYNST